MLRAPAGILQAHRKAAQEQRTAPSDQDASTSGQPASAAAVAQLSEARFARRLATYHGLRQQDDSALDAKVQLLHRSVSSTAATVW
jgi:hypothetical protein